MQQSMLKHIEIQKAAYFTIVCIILLIGLSSNIQETFAKQHVYESL